MVAMKWNARCGLVVWIAIGAINESAEVAKHLDVAQGANEPLINKPSGSASRSAIPPLIISEFLARNFKGIKDEDGQTSDWIEIYNPGPLPRDLAGWHLTDSMSRPDRWTFPATNLDGKKYLLVFASGKNRSVTGRPLHANFKLSAKGGSLGLFDPNRLLVDSYSHYPPQEANISFGRVENRATLFAGESAWRYFLQPSPQAPALTGAQVLGAVIREVSDPPVHAILGTPIKITTSIAAKSEELSEITLHYRVMFDVEKQLAMAPEDRPNPGGAGVHTFSAAIPGAVFGAGQMIRWYVTATLSGLQSRWPLNSGPLPLPRYLGTVIEPPDRITALPVYDFFVEGYRFPTDGHEESGIDSDSGSRGTLFAYGQLYDNIFIRIKGTTSRHLRKQSHRIDFNPGHEFRWDKDRAAIRQLSLNAEYPDPSYARQNLSCWLQRESGTGAAPHFPVRAQMNGRFWQLAFHTMPAGEELLRFMGLDPHGALYKQVEQISAQPPGRTTKQTRKRESRSDYQAFVQAISERQPLEKRRGSL